MKSNRSVPGSRLYRAKRGANMVEYIIVVGMVALICIVMFGRFGQAIHDKVREQRSVVQSGINGGASQ